MAAIEIGYGGHGHAGLVLGYRLVLLGGREQSAFQFMLAHHFYVFTEGVVVRSMGVIRSLGASLFPQNTGFSG